MSTPNYSKAYTDSLQAEIAELKDILISQLAEIEHLRSANLMLESENAKFRVEVAKLRTWVTGRDV